LAMPTVPPERTTRNSSAAATWGRGANWAPKVEATTPARPSGGSGPRPPPGPPAGPRPRPGSRCRRPPPAPPCPARPRRPPPGRRRPARTAGPVPGSPPQRPHELLAVLDGLRIGHGIPLALDQFGAFSGRDTARRIPGSQQQDPARRTAVQRCGSGRPGCLSRPTGCWSPRTRVGPTATGTGCGRPNWPGSRPRRA
jgi:hypothetical protein